MDDIEYSNDAMNVLNAFYDSTTIIYVEGEDDVLFWDRILTQFGNISCTVHSTGGCNELDKYISKIVSGEINAIAARDVDFLLAMGKKIDHPRVLYTHGYSIENSLFVNEAIYLISRAICKDQNLDSGAIDNWTHDLAVKLKSLIALDVANAVLGAGKRVVGENCEPFMKSKVSHWACEEKIQIHCDGLAPAISKRELARIEDNFVRDSLTSLQNLRGHFFASAVAKFIVGHGRSIGRKIALSVEALFGIAITVFENLCTTERHPHLGHYRESAERAASTFNLRLNN